MVVAPPAQPSTAAESELRAMNAALDSLAYQLEDAQHRVKELSAEHARTVEELARATRAVAELEARAADAEGKHEVMHTAAEVTEAELMARVAALTAENAQLREKLSTSRAAVTTFASRQTDGESAAASLEERCAAEARRSEAAEAEASALRETLNGTAAELAEVLQRSEDVQATLERTVARLAEQESLVGVLSAESTRLQDELATAQRHATPVLADSSVDPTHLELAKQVVSALTVSYQVDAVLNPALQRQYRKLQELARQFFPLADNPLHPAGGTALAKAGEEGPSTDGAEKTPQELDNTLPDYEGMQRFAALFQSFNKEVLGKDYNAFLYCPQPRVAGSATRRPRDSAAGAGAMEAAGPTAASAEEDACNVSIEELIRRAAAENAWDGLIIPQLKEYLATANVSSGGARRKADLIELVKQHFPLPS